MEDFGLSLSFRKFRFQAPSIDRKGVLKPVSISCRAASLGMAATEAAAIILSSVLGGFVYSTANHSPADPNLAVAYGLIGSLLYGVIAQAAGLYRFPVLLHVSRTLGRIVATCVILLLSLTAVLFFLKVGSEVSRGAVLGSAVFVVLLCCGARLAAVPILRAMLRRGAVIGDAVHVVGDVKELGLLPADYLLSRFGLTERGRTALSEADYEAELGVVAEALETARRTRALRIVVVLGPENLVRLGAIQLALSPSPLSASLLPSFVLRTVAERFGESEKLSLTSLQRAPLNAAERISKRAVDIVGAALGLIILAPILLVAALVVRTSSKGPVIFRQRRNGFAQRPFWIYKFRTMTVLEDGESVVQAQKNDDRVTRVGRDLRRTSIDELPQLWNVLRGDMSLVGPRPHALAHDKHFSALIDDYCFRHHVKPGITGWAQVNQLRGETPQNVHMKRRVEYDLWYINHWSLYLDFRILFRTIFAVFNDPAY